MDVNNAVCDGLTALYLLNLPYSPAKAKMEMVTSVWLNIFTEHCRHWDSERDKGRLEAAFARIAAEAERWPVPREVIDRIPPRKPTIDLPRPKRSKEDVERIKNITKNLAEILSINGDKNEKIQ